MTSQTIDDHGIPERAAEWLSALETGGPAEKTAFALWLKESPRHVEEFLYITALSQEFSSFAADAPVEVRGFTPQVLPLGAATADTAALQQTSRPRRRWYAAAAAVTVTSALGLLMGDSLVGWKTYATDVGEQKSFELTDGSLVHLNTRSRVKVRMSAGARQVRLVQGEALFKVAADSARPFDVQAGNAFVHAIGTEFNVYRRSGETSVSVLEGRVGVIGEDADAPSIPKIVDAGEEARVDLEGRTSVAAADTAAAVAWRQRRLVFKTERLETIAAEFNRYNRTAQIRIDGADVRTRRLSGVFDADDPESLVQFLTRDSDLQFRARGNWLIVWRQKTATSPR